MLGIFYARFHSMEIEKNSYCQKLLTEEYLQRKNRNPMYSLRAFARDLGVSKTSLSDLFTRKRKLSRSNVMKVIEKLSMPPTKRELLFSELKRKPLKSSNEDEISKVMLEEDVFRLISDWYYIAILNLIKTKYNKANPALVAAKLGISKLEAETAIERLLRLKLIEEKNGRYVRTSLPITTSRDIPSAAIRKYHRDNLKLAELSLDNDEVNLREFSSMTMAIDPSKLPMAKDLLMKTKRKIEKILESGIPTEVYTLTFQLFPLTKKSDGQINMAIKEKGGNA